MTAARYALARTAGSLAAGLSRRTGRGDGTTVGGRVTLLLDPTALAHAAVGRDFALVSGTNGKTTTRALLVAALATQGPVVSNSGGANMSAGLTAALTKDRTSPNGVLEVDEPNLPVVNAAVHARAVVLLNLSRDQLDRYSEVGRLAQVWRGVLTLPDPPVPIANCDDPLVVWAASAAPKPIWVSAGQRWDSDAAVCPQCGGVIDRDGGDWRSDCGFARPTPDWVVSGDTVTDPTGANHTVSLSIPGDVNVGNAALAAAAAGLWDVAPADAFAAMTAIGSVEGRYLATRFEGIDARLLLAKNPAGWIEALSMVPDGDVGVVVAVNSRAADGRDPSWLWDVRFEVLQGRSVVATGERARDVAVRLRYAGVDHVTVVDEAAALRAAGQYGPVEVLANYTAFQTYRRVVRDDERIPGDPVRIALIYPTVLGTYGDGGNATVLAQRLRWRDLPAEVIEVEIGQPLPEQADIYVLGGGEDSAQTLAVSRLSDGSLNRAIAAEKVLFAVCAGFQILGATFLDGTGSVHAGLGLIDCATDRLAGERAVGELLGDATLDGVGVVTGYENHGGRTVLGSGARPFATVRSGVGNGDSGVDGAIQGNVIATYLHGPALARNPALADELIRRVVGDLPPIDDAEEHALREERFAALRKAKVTQWRRQWRPAARQS